MISSTLIAEGIYLDINYDYDMNTYKLINDVKEYLQKKSDELLDTVLTDWQKYSGSSYSRSNMGRLTIEKDEFLG